jgi:hypothetical protein
MNSLVAIFASAFAAVDLLTSSGASARIRTKRVLGINAAILPRRVDRDETGSFGS